MRWFVPPPAFTAILSNIRNPGAVLRVSSRRVRVPASSFTYFAVSVAMPDIRCRMLRDRRSPSSRQR